MNFWEGFIACCTGLFIILFIFCLFAAVISPDTNTTVDSNVSAVDEATGVQVKVIYDGAWHGAVSDVGSTRSVSGTGNETIDLNVDEDTWIVTADAQKKDGSSKTLTIQILKDGKVLEESSTDTEYGMAVISAKV